MSRRVLVTVFLEEEPGGFRFVVEGPGMTPTTGGGEDPMLRALCLGLLEVTGSDDDGESAALDLVHQTAAHIRAARAVVSPRAAAVFARALHGMTRRHRAGLRMVPTGDGEEG